MAKKTVRSLIGAFYLAGRAKLSLFLFKLSFSFDFIIYTSTHFTEDEKSKQDKKMGNTIYFDVKGSLLCCYIASVQNAQCDQQQTDVVSQGKFSKILLICQVR